MIKVKLIIEGTPEEITNFLNALTKESVEDPPYVPYPVYPQPEPYPQWPIWMDCVDHTSSQSLAIVIN